MNVPPAPAPVPAVAPVWGQVLQQRWVRAVGRTWWWTLTPVAVLGYGAVAGQAGIVAPVGGLLFIAGMLVVATVARNGSAEAMRPGSVRPWSLLRAAWFGTLLHGGLLTAAAVGGGLAAPLVVWTLLGGALAVLTRPTTLAAFGIGDTPAEPAPGRMTTPEIVAELQASLPLLRSTTDAAAWTALVARRGLLVEQIEARDPMLLRVLLERHDVAVEPTEGERGAA